MYDPTGPYMISMLREQRNFQKNSEECRVGCVLFIKKWHHTLHISELKYAPTHGIFPSFLEIDEAAGAFTPDLRLFKSNTA